MGRDVVVAALLSFVLVVTGCCSTTDQAVATDPDTPAVRTAGWESPEAATTRIPEPKPVELRRSEAAPSDDVTSLREANEELMEQVGQLTERVRSMQESRQEPSAAEPAAVPAPEPAPAPARPVVTAHAVRSALLSAGASELGVATNDEDQITVTLHGQGSFGPGKANLSPQAKATLDKLAGVLKRDLAEARLRIEGHTDSDPIRKSSWESNEALSAARAAAVADYLTRSAEISSSRVESIGYGASMPIASNKTSEGKARNRRVEIVILP